jgi:hypothetical protein
LDVHNFALAAWADGQHRIDPVFLPFFLVVAARLASTSGEDDADGDS